MIRYLLLSLCLFSALAQATIVDVFKFDSPQQEQYYQQVTGQLRCLVCQNESIADSNANLAQDMRGQVYRMIKAGKTEKEINAYMVHRYGDYVLYNPPFQMNTLVLWIGPFVLLVVGIWLMLRTIRTRRTESQTHRVKDTELHAAADLLDDPKKDQDTPS